MNKVTVNKFLNSIILSYSQIFFSTNLLFAGLLFIISFIDVYIGLSGLIAVTSANIFAYVLGFNTSNIKNGLYGFNALLVGFGIGVYFKLSILLVILIVFVAIFTVIISVALEGVFTKYRLPFLSIPFLIAIWTFYLASKEFTYLGISQRGIYYLNDLYNIGGQWLVDAYNYVNNIKTNNKIAVGDTINKVVIGVVQGDVIKRSTETSVYLPGLGTYLLSVDSTGKVSINGKYATNGKGIIREGKDAIPLSSPVCTKQTTHYFGEYISAVSCDSYRRIAKEINFNIITGELMQRIATQETPSTCILHRGKYSAYYDCSPQQDKWSDTQIQREKDSIINISDLLQGKQEAIAEIRNQIRSFGNIPSTQSTVVKYVGDIARANEKYSGRYIVPYFNKK